MEINKTLIPIKAHYFFFMAAMGPILPQINVFAKELGIPADIMGFVTSILPFLYIIAKPLVGFLIDYFTSLRKVIFSLIIIVMTLCYACLYFVPRVDHKVGIESSYNFTISSGIHECTPEMYNKHNLCSISRPVNCEIICRNKTLHHSFEGLTIYSTSDNSSVIKPVDDNSISTNKTNSKYILCFRQVINLQTDMENCTSKCTPNHGSNVDCVSNTITFWSFVVLMSIGTIGFNVANCVSDATCFDMLGETQTMKYGAQRVWGTIGFGIAALIAGISVYLNPLKSFNVDSMGPALLIMIIFCVCDIMSINWLTLPTLSGSDSIIRDVWELLRRKSIAIFLIFATLAGIIDSFIIYYMFWHLEEVAEASGTMDSIKLIEGCVVAAECLGGEILFFLISGEILKKIGYTNCLSLCFFVYSLRLGLISLITNPWYLVGIELFMQGPSYALCYTCIVAYASVVAPAGTTATVQGLVAGMDDGIGFALGSLIGGQMFKHLGGAKSFQYFSFGAIVVCITHILLHFPYKKIDKKRKKRIKEKTLDPSEEIKLELKERSII